jgi:hypothetical protein
MFSMGQNTLLHSHAAAQTFGLFCTGVPSHVTRLVLRSTLCSSPSGLVCWPHLLR